MAASKTLTPEQRRERARIAGKASQNPEPVIRRAINRAGELTDQQTEDFIREVLARRPRFSPERLARLRVILTPAENDPRAGGAA